MSIFSNKSHTKEGKWEAVKGLRTRFQLTEELCAERGLCSYLAKERVSGEEVMIQILSPSRIGDIQDPKSKTGKIAKLLMSVRNPRLPSVFEVQPLDDNILIVGQRLTGRPLIEVINERALSTGEIDTLFMQILSGLETLHSKGLQHGELSCSNILYSKEYGATLLGLLHDSEMLSHGGITKISPLRYKPPEHHLIGFTDARSDVYTVGVLLLEVLSRELWLEHLSDIQAMKYLMAKDFVVPRVLPEETGDKYLEIIDRALSIDPSHRFKDAAEMRLAFWERDQENKEKQARRPSKGKVSVEKKEKDGTGTDRLRSGTYLKERTHSSPSISTSLEFQSVARRGELQRKKLFKGFQWLYFLLIVTILCYLLKNYVEV